MSSDALTAVPEPARVIGGEHRGHAGYQTSARSIGTGERSAGGQRFGASLHSLGA
jgi:hypothetical protein